MARIQLSPITGTCLVLFCFACGGADQPATPAADVSEQPAPAAAAASAPTVAAQPEADDAVTHFDVRTAALGTSYFGVHILLTDLEEHAVGQNGKWELLSGDLDAPYHRLMINIDELPTEPGEIAVTRLEYSVHDADSGPFNYGWTSFEGGITVEEVRGAVDIKEGQVHNVRLKGNFDIINNKGGRFQGEFSIDPAGD